MIPNEDYDFEAEEFELDDEDEFDLDYDEVIEPSKTYAMVGDRFIGMIDDVEAIKQSIYNNLLTEEDEFEIYDEDYGIALNDLYGEVFPFAASKLKERIEDTLTVDDRIDSVDNFDISLTEHNTILCKFTVNTVDFDSIDIEREVEI